jgi:hypothetical protein
VLHAPRQAAPDPRWQAVQHGPRAVAHARRVALREDEPARPRRAEGAPALQLWEAVVQHGPPAAGFAPVASQPGATFVRQH